MDTSNQSCFVTLYMYFFFAAWIRLQHFVPTSLVWLGSSVSSFDLDAPALIPDPGILEKSPAN